MCYSIFSKYLSEYYKQIEGIKIETVLNNAHIALVLDLMNFIMGCGQKKPYMNKYICHKSVTQGHNIIWG